MVGRWEKKDSYRRVIGKVYIGERYINFEMVAEGWTWHCKNFSKDNNLAKSESAAKADRKGLWVDKAVQPAWAWLKRNKTPSASSRRVNSSLPSNITRTFTPSARPTSFSIFKRARSVVIHSNALVLALGSNPNGKSLPRWRSGKFFGDLSWRSCVVRLECGSPL